MKMAYLNQIWQLARMLYCIVPINKWVLVAGIFLSIAGGLIQVVWGEPIVLVAGLAVIAMFFVIVAFTLPAQLVTIASSRQFDGLTNIRIFGCVILMLNSMLATLFIIFVVAHKGLSFSLLHGYVAICSVIILLQLAAVWLSQSVWLQLMLWLLWFIAIPFGQWFIAQPIWVSVVILAVGLSAFFQWWLGWKPAVHIKSMTGVSQVDLHRLQFSQFGWWNTSWGTKPKTAAGTFLLGAYDGYITYLKRGLIALSSAGVTYVVLRLLIGAEATNTLLTVLAGLLFCIYIAACGGTLTYMVFKNGKKIWLLCMLPRAHMFNFIERFYYPYLLIGILPIVITGILVSLILAPNYYTIDRVAFYFISSLLLSCLNFYLGLLFYKKMQASFLLLGWLSGAIYTLGFIAIFSVSGFGLLEQFDNLLSLSSWIIVVGGLAIWWLRWLAERSWQRVDFSGGQ